jgi:hypothetical protein
MARNGDNYVFKDPAEEMIYYNDNTAEGEHLLKLQYYLLRTKETHRVDLEMSGQDGATSMRAGRGDRAV